MKDYGNNFEKHCLIWQEQDISQDTTHPPRRVSSEYRSSRPVVSYKNVAFKIIAKFTKKDSFSTVFFLWILRNFFKNINFVEHLQMTIS